MINSIRNVRPDKAFSILQSPGLGDRNELQITWDVGFRSEHKEVKGLPPTVIFACALNELLCEVESRRGKVSNHRVRLYQDSVSHGYCLGLTI